MTIADEPNMKTIAKAEVPGLTKAQNSTSHFIRSFREGTGKTHYQFLLERRVQRAQTLMRDPRASLAEIARSTGFADQHHLARVFRRFTGTTPSIYRRSL